MSVLKYPIEIRANLGCLRIAKRRQAKLRCLPLNASAIKRGLGKYQLPFTIALRKLKIEYYIIPVFISCLIKQLILLSLNART